MRSLILAGVLAAVLVGGHDADAALIKGSFTATVTSGTDHTGVLGLPANTDLTGLTLTGTFSYDPAQLPADISGGAVGYRLYYGTPVGVSTISETIAGHSFVFPAVTAQYLYLQNDGSGSAGFSLETVNFPNFSFSHGASVGVATSSGQFAVDPTNPGSVGFGVTNPTGFLPGCCAAQIYEGGGATWAIWHYRVDTISVGVPELTTWAMMLIGFAGVGVQLRRRRDAIALTGAQ